MRRRIEQLLNGIFEYERGTLSITPETLQLESVSGATLHGSFAVEGGQGQKIRGFLYPSDARMTCSPVEFQGIVNEIRYQLDCSGLHQGSLTSGRIVICSDCGEYELPYTVRIEEDQGEEELPFSTLSEFAQLAQSDDRKAYRCFLMPGFRSILKGQSQLLSLYDGLGILGNTPSNMEEFLTGAGLKEQLCFSIEDENGEEIPDGMLDFGELKEPEKKLIRVRKNTWGYQSIAVESDALFLRPEQKKLTTGDFMGDTYDLNLILDTNLMHAGKNCARLTLQAGYQTLFVGVTVKRSENQPKDRQQRIRRMMMKELVNFYISFRMQRIDVTAWIEHSVSVISSYKRAGGDNVFAELFLIQLYFTDDQKQKAQKMLDQIELRRDRLDTVESYCYYLYISTFFYNEASYVDRVEAEVAGQFFAHQTSWQLQWILFYLQEKYLNDSAARYDAVEELFQNGCRTRIMYVEAWLALKQDPFLLRHLGEFELHLLRFADQEKAMTADILHQVASLTMHQHTFDRRLFQVLTNGWQLYPSEDLLRAICQLLIRADKWKPAYFKWYEKGIESGLRLNGLYEAYLETIEISRLRFRDLPQIIQMYFGYDTSLDCQRRAAIYRSILDDRESYPQTWHTHRAAIERFALEQLEAEHISEDLMVLYRNFLRESMITDQLAEKLVRLLFTYEVVCDSTDICQIIVHSARSPGERLVSLSEGKAFVRIYDPDSVVLAADTKGRRFGPSAIRKAKRVYEMGMPKEDSVRTQRGGLPEGLEKMLSWCAKKVPDYPGLVVYVCSVSQKAEQISERLLPYYRLGCEWTRFSVDFRNELRRALLGFYMEHPREESLPEFLDQISYRDYALVDKTALITLLAEESRCADAFALLDIYGAEDIPLMQLVRICSRMVLELEFEENAMLLSLCRQCFDNGKFDDKLLRYLILYYEGSVESMKQIWLSASQFGLDTMMLEDKIMMMMLFTREGTRGSEPIFESYLKKKGRMNLCQAYVNLKSYEYFVKGIPAADSVFSFTEEEYGYLSEHGSLEEQLEVCRLALLQYYVRAGSLTDVQQKYVSEMLDEFCAKDMRFAFFKQFDYELLKPFHLEGRAFAEHVCNPKNTVKIFYRYKKDGVSDEEAPWKEELVSNRFEGIFVYEFNLFAGEEMEYFFVETDGTEEKVSDRRMLHIEQEMPDSGMYGVLNRLCAAVQDGDEKSAEDALDAYLTLEYLAGEVFTLI